MDIIANFNTENNFWSTHPLIKVHDIFNTLYKEDKSKGKENSSRIMWGITLYVSQDPQNTYKNLASKKREDLIIKEVIKDPKFKFQDYKDELSFFEELVLTPAEKYMEDWKKMLEERKEFMKSIEYSLDTYKMKEDMLKNTKNIFEDYKKIQEELDKEGPSGIVKGKSMESAQEKELI